MKNCLQLFISTHLAKHLYNLRFCLVQLKFAIGFKTFGSEVDGDNTARKAKR